MSDPADCYKPLRVYGDGNCMFRSVSLLLYGTEEYRSNATTFHKTFIEITTNAYSYNTDDPACNCSFQDDINIMLPSYDTLRQEVVTNGCETGIAGLKL